MKEELIILFENYQQILQDYSKYKLLIENRFMEKYHLDNGKYYITNIIDIEGDSISFQFADENNDIIYNRDMTITIDQIIMAHEDWKYYIEEK